MDADTENGLRAILAEELKAEEYGPGWCDAVAFKRQGTQDAQDQKFADAAIRAMKRAFQMGMDSVSAETDE